MNHRKLFPTSTTNQTLVCPDVCDSTCPDGCYPYSDTYFVPPPLPPPPPGPPLTTKHGHSISPYVIIIATLLGIAFLIVSYYLIIVKNCFRPRRRQQEGTEENFLDENRGPATIDHPIWYIRTVGLQPSIINSIRVFQYKKGDSLIDGTDCSVCLNEFQDDEILRLLPKCNHAFHIPCIDTWLRSHTNCPVCRAGIVSNGVTTPVAPVALNSDTSGPLEDNRVEITDSAADGGLINNQARDGEVDENRTRIEDEVELPQDDMDIQAESTKMGVNLDENAGSWVINDSDESNIVQDEIQQVKRSISADSLVIAKIRLAMVNLPVTDYVKSPVDRRGDAHICEFPEQNGPETRMHQGNVDAAIALPSHQRDVPVKRSFSYGGRSFLSGHSRSSNSILPL